MADVLNLKDIAEAGLMAPSGDNLQPWKFEVDHTGIDVFLDPKMAHTVYDYRQHASLVSIGAAIENIIVAAKRFGKEPSVSYFPTRDNPYHVARVAFTANLGEGSPEEVRLYEQVAHRGVNRSVYKKTPLTPEQRAAFVQIPEKLGVAGSVRFVEDGAARKELAKAFNNSDRLLFLNRILHDGIFSYFRWTPEENEATRNGLDVQTLGLAKSDLSMLGLLRSWPLTKLFGLLGVADIVAKKTARQYASGSATVAIVMKGNRDEDFITGGRIVEHLWLMATERGLAIHPSFGFVVLGQRVRMGDTAIFSPSDIKLIRESYAKINTAFNVSEGETITMLFRLGVPEAPPVARALRKYPENVITYKT